MQVLAGPAHKLGTSTSWKWRERKGEWDKHVKYVVLILIIITIIMLYKMGVSSATPKAFLSHPHAKVASLQGKVTSFARLLLLHILHFNRNISFFPIFLSCPAPSVRLVFFLFYVFVVR